MDFFDDANKALGYTVLEGDPRYHYFSAVMKFVPGAAAGTTDAMWTATYVPVGDMGPPEVNPLRGGRQQPHQSLEKLRKYKGGSRRHEMAGSPSPKMRP
jgi:hypothetical protein